MGANGLSGIYQQAPGRFALFMLFWSTFLLSYLVSSECNWMKEVLALCIQDSPRNWYFSGFPQDLQVSAPQQ